MRKGTAVILFAVENVIWVILLIFVMISAFFIPKFFGVKNFINIFYAVSALSMIVLAQGICLLSGNFDLSVESTIGFAPMIGALLIFKWLPGINPLIAIFITLSVGALIGLFNGLIVTKIKLNAFLQTLALLIFLRGLMLFLMPRTLYNFPKTFSFLGNAKIGSFPVSILVVLFIYFSFYIIFTKTAFGRRFYAVGGNPMAAITSGINVDLMVTMAFVISGTLSALGGLLMAGRMDAVVNSMGEGLAMVTFAGAVLGGVSLKGGVGKITGILGGVLLLGVIDNALTIIGMNVFLIYATKGFILWMAIITDQLKENLRQRVLMNEEIYKYVNINVIN